MIYHQTREHGLRAMPNGCLQAFDPKGKADSITLHGTLAERARCAWRKLEGMTHMPDRFFDERFDAMLRRFRNDATNL